MSEPRFAVIGTGRMASTMMRTFAHANVRVMAVASRDPQRRRQFAKAFDIPVVGEDLASLVRTTDIEAVYIANGNVDHATTTIAALEAGKAVLCEKPLALSTTECLKVAEAARETGTLCVEAIWTLHLPAYHRFLDLARSNACGQPTHLYSDFGYPVSKKAQPRLVSRESGGVLADRAIYLIALALKIFGRVERVDAQLDVTDDGVDQQASLQLTHERGGHSQLSTSITSLMSNTALLACSRGYIQLEEPLIGSERVLQRSAAVEQVWAEDSAVFAGATRRLAHRLRQSPMLRRLKQALPDLRREHHSYGMDQYLPQLYHFLALLSAKARESDVVPIELSLEIQRIIDCARAVSRRGS